MQVCIHAKALSTACGQVHISHIQYILTLTPAEFSVPEDLLEARPGIWPQGKEGQEVVREGGLG